MGSQSNDHQNLEKEYMSIGLLAHVDAGKTTLSEAVLHRTGAIRSAGRVDHGDAFLDTDAMERDRGITIFSKQASFTTFPGGLRERVWTLVDTPGHADFSTEMERVLQVLDCAVLIISAADGVTGQVRTLWRLLDHYGVPAFLFVNKMDQSGADRASVDAQIRQELGTACVDLQEAFAGLTGKDPQPDRKDAAGKEARSRPMPACPDFPLSPPTCRRRLRSVTRA